VKGLTEVSTSHYFSPPYLLFFKLVNSLIKINFGLQGFQFSNKNLCLKAGQQIHLMYLQQICVRTSSSTFVIKLLKKDKNLLIFSTDDCLFLFFVCTEKASGSWPNNKSRCTKIFNICQTNLEQTTGMWKAAGTIQVFSKQVFPKCNYSKHTFLDAFLPKKLGG